MFQLGAALLDACVLATLARSDTYGYALTQSVREVITVSESALYPVLRRLQKEGMLIAYDVPFNGRNRRYYRITASGQERLSQLRADWAEFERNINHVLEGDAT
jgi:PadR family transcriptional regulator PadR